MFNILLPVYLLIIQCSMISNLVNAKDFRDTNNRWRNFESLSRTRLLVGPGKGPNWSTSTTPSTTSTSSSTESSSLYFSVGPALGKKLEFYRFPFERVTLNKNNLYHQIHNEEKQERVAKDAYFPLTAVTTHPPITLLTTESIIFDEIIYNNGSENTALYVSSPDSIKINVQSTSLNPSRSQGHGSYYQKDEHIVDYELVEFFTSTEMPKVVSDNTDSSEVDSWYTTTVPDVIGMDNLENVLKSNENRYPLEESLNSLEKIEDSTFTTLSDKFVTTDISNGFIDISELIYYDIDDLDFVDEDIINHSGENSTTNLLTIANISINSTTILIVILVVAVILLYVKSSNKTSVDKDGTKYWTNFPTIQVADKQKIFPMPCSLISKNEIEKMKASYF